MKTICLMFAATTLLAASLARAAPAPGPVETGEAPLGCLLHFTSAVPEATRFGDDGSLVLAWEDSLGRRSRAEIGADGRMVLHLPEGDVLRLSPPARVLTVDERLRLDGIVAAYWRLGVDLVGRRHLSEAETEHRPSGSPSMVWDNQNGIWLMLEACEELERRARANCSAGCATEGMGSLFRSGECGAGASCTCVYYASTDPHW